MGNLVSSSAINLDLLTRLHAVVANPPHSPVRSRPHSDSDGTIQPSSSTRRSTPHACAPSDSIRMTHGAWFVRLSQTTSSSGQHAV